METLLRELQRGRRDYGVRCDATRLTQLTSYPSSSFYPSFEFQMACDNNRIHEGAAMGPFHFYSNSFYADAVHRRLCLRSNLSCNTLGVKDATLKTHPEKLDCFPRLTEQMVSYAKLKSL